MRVCKDVCVYVFLYVRVWSWLKRVRMSEVENIGECRCNELFICVDDEVCTHFSFLLIFSDFFSIFLIHMFSVVLSTFCVLSKFGTIASCIVLFCVKGGQVRGIE